MTRSRLRSEQHRGPTAVLLVPAVIGLLFLLLPFAGLLWRAPWRTIGERLSQPGALTALRLSLETGAITTALCLFFGIPIAYLLARTTFPGRRLVRALVLLPVILPPVVGGVALLTAFGRMGLVGQFAYRWWGFSLPFTTPAVVLAQMFVAMPFLILAVEGALRAADERYEEAAATLGASRWTTFRRITLPLVLPGVGAGALLCFARALGEFGATITFAGNYPGTTQTMPIEVYQTLEEDPFTAIVLSLLLVIVSLVILVSLRGRWMDRIS